MRGEELSMMELSISQPLYQQVHENIKQAILSGKLEAGERLIVKKLAEDLKISRTPLREALRQLESEGLLVSKESSLFVVKLDSKDFKELYQCRVVLEKEIMRLVVNAISSEELDKLKQSLEKADIALEKQEYLKLLKLNTKFHDILLESCPNKRAVDLVKQVRNLLLIYRAKILGVHHYNYGINNEHKQIFEALKKRDAEKILAAIELHLRNDEKRGLEMFQEIEVVSEV